MDAGQIVVANRNAGTLSVVDKVATTNYLAMLEMIAFGETIEMICAGAKGSAHSHCRR